MIINRLRAVRLSERGVAMITVILVGAALTVVTSTAAVISIQDFRSGADDRRATEALAFAEAGVDRMLTELRRTDYGWERLNEAGCRLAPIAVPQGDLGSNRYYNAYLTVYTLNPTVAPADRLPVVGSWRPGDPWSTANDSRTVCTDHENVPPTRALLFAITSTGEHPTATRVVRQVVRISTRGLPIGMYADSVNVQGGTPRALSISLVTPGSISDRDNLAFSGLDPYYKMGHFWEGASMDEPAPASVHARGTINCNNSSCRARGNREHPGPLNCDANGTANGQSRWDQSGLGGSLSGVASCPGYAGLPPYSNFTEADLERSRPTPQLTPEDYALLKQAAQDRGLYCRQGTSGPASCTTPTSSFTSSSLNIQSVAGVGNRYVAYFDFPSTGDPFANSREVVWSAAVSPCSDDPAVNKSVIIIVRYGSVQLSGQDEINGAFFVPEGRIWLRGQGGTFKVHGTMVAKQIDIGGNAEVLLSSCWVNNMSTLFLNVRALSWSEVDR